MEQRDSLLVCIRDEIATFVQAFPDTTPAARQNLQQLLVGETKTFLQASVDVLASVVPPTEGSRHLLGLLAKEKAMADTLVTPGLCPLGQCVAVARQLGAVLEHDLDVELADQVQNGMTDPERLLRVLEIMEAAGVERRCLLYQVDLLATKDPGIRSKSAKLITRSSRKASIAARFLLDPDPRVQASAVEGLWSLDAAEAAPLLIAAARSRNHRVVANAAIGLYRFHDPAAIRLIWNLARNPDLQTRTAGVWVMGESADPRFLDFLEELSRDGKGVPRQVVLRALGRIRARQAEALEHGRVDVRIHRATPGPGGARTLEFSLGPTSADFTQVHALEFSISEGSAAIDRFDLTARPGPPVLVTDFVMPRLISLVDPYRVATDDAIRRCIALGRRDDQWRIDRYCTDGRIPRNWAEKTPSPYDDTIPIHKLYRGFFNDLSYLDKILEAPPQKERAAHDLANALERSLEAITGVPGTHHMFIFLADNALEREPRLRWGKQLAEAFGDARIAPYVLVPTGVNCDELREPLMSVPGCVIEECSFEEMPQRVEYAYARLVNNFEIAYTLPGGTGTGRLSICGTAGVGSAPFTVR